LENGVAHFGESEPGFHSGFGHERMGGEARRRVQFKDVAAPERRDAEVDAGDSAAADGFAGFFGKFHLFFSGASTGHYTLVAFAVLNNVIALFYYLQLIKAAWVDEPDGHLNPLRLTKRQREVIILLSIAVILLGFVPFLSNNIFAGFMN
jgi:hypothetical protein